MASDWPSSSKAKLGNKVPKRTVTFITTSKTGRIIYRKQTYSSKKRRSKCKMAKELAGNDPVVIAEPGSSCHDLEASFISMAGRQSTENPVPLQGQVECPVSQQNQQEYPPKKRSCVGRALSGYNLFCQEQSSLSELQSLTCRERFSKLSEDWKVLSEEERGTFRERAKKSSAGRVPNVKKETKKSLQKMLSIIDHLQSLDGSEVFFVSVGGERGTTYGGSEGGRAYVEANIHLLDNFRTFVDARDAGQQAQHTRQRLEVPPQKIRELFNSKYASAINKPNAKMPYSSLTEKGITMEGMPAGLSLKSPVTYGPAQRRKLWEARKEMKCVIIPQKPSG